MKSKQIVVVLLALVVVGATAWFSAQWNSAASDDNLEAAPAEPRTSSGEAESRTQGLTTLVVDAANSEALYRVREQLAGVNFPNDAVGRTKDISGVVVIAADGQILTDRSAVTVNVARLQSDQSRRDNFIRMNTLQTSRYPEVHFVPTEIRGLPLPLPAEGQAAITVRGELTIRNVTRPVEWTGTATFTPDGMNVAASTVITFEEFQLAKPRVAAVLSVDDQIRLEVDIRFRRQS